MPLTQLVCRSSCHLQLKSAAVQIHERVFASMVRAQQASWQAEPDVGSCLGRDVAGSNASQPWALQAAQLPVQSNQCDRSPATVSVASQPWVTPQSSPSRPPSAWPRNLSNCCGHLPAVMFPGDILLEALSVGWAEASPCLHRCPHLSENFSPLHCGEGQTPYLALSCCSLLLSIHFLGLKRLDIAFLFPPNHVSSSHSLGMEGAHPPQHSESLECIFIT